MLVKALRKLYKKLTGTACTEVTSAGVINKIAEDYVAPTGTLPTVTAADNGKVLKVSGGAWAKGEEVVELPAVTAADNGKVLTVVNGVWAAASLPE